VTLPKRRSKKSTQSQESMHASQDSPEMEEELPSPKKKKGGKRGGK
jgi:hypothetical protein